MPKSNGKNCVISEVSASRLPTSGGGDGPLNTDAPRGCRSGFAICEPDRGAFQVALHLQHGLIFVRKGRRALVREFLGA